MLKIREIQDTCTFVASQEDDSMNFDKEYKKIKSKWTMTHDYGDCFVFENETHYLINDCGLQTLYKK